MVIAEIVVLNYTVTTLQTSGIVENVIGGRNKMEYVTMEIEPYEWDLAEKYTMVEMNNARGNPIFQTKNAKNDHIIGHIGQIKFDQWLGDMEVKHEYINDLNGIGDKGRDFIINNFIVDVKTAELDRPLEESNTDIYKFLIAEQQYLKHPDVSQFFHIQVAQDGSELYLMGGIHYMQVQIHPVKKYKNNINPAYNIPLDDLTPAKVWLQELININKLHINDFEL